MSDTEYVVLLNLGGQLVGLGLFGIGMSRMSRWPAALGVSLSCGSAAGWITLAWRLGGFS